MLRGVSLPLSALSVAGLVETSYSFLFSVCKTYLFCKITSIYEEDFLQPESTKDYSKIQNSPLSHVAVLSQTGVAGDSKLV